MKIGVIAAVGVLASACGPQGGAETCRPTEAPKSLIVGTDNTNHPLLSCQTVQEQMDLAKSIEGKDFPPPNVLATINITYEDADTLGQVNGENILGEYNNMYDITLTWSGIGLAHELLHVTGKYVYHDSDADNEAHTFWNQRGWFGFDYAYTQQFAALP